MIDSNVLVVFYRS